MGGRKSRKSRAPMIKLVNKAFSGKRSVQQMDRRRHMIREAVREKEASKVCEIAGILVAIPVVCVPV